MNAKTMMNLRKKKIIQVSLQLLFHDIIIALLLWLWHFFCNCCIFVTIFLFLSDDPDASNGSKSTRAERARKKKSEANSNADKNKDSATDGKNNKNNKNGEDKKDVVTEADIKIEPDKSGRRTPLHARDMDPVSCSNFTNFFFLCENFRILISQFFFSRMNPILLSCATIIGVFFSAFTIF